MGLRADRFTVKKGIAVLLFDAELLKVEDEALALVDP